MSHTKHTSKRKRARKAVPMLGVAGVSLVLAGSASAGTSGPAADIASRDTAPRHEITLGEEEISDVSLATFYVFDKENAGTPKVSEKLAWWRGCRGCRGCSWRGCRGCGWRGCGGCGWRGCRC
jgi:hypothetical protein